MKWKKIMDESTTSPQMNFWRKYNEEIKSLIEDFLEKKGIYGASYEISDWFRREGTISNDIGEFPITVGTIHQSDPHKPIGYWRPDIDTGKVIIYQSWMKPKPGSYTSQGTKQPIPHTDDEDAFNDFVDTIRKNLHNLEKIVQDFKDKIESKQEIGESDMDESDSSSRFILHDVDEITPEHDGYGSLASNADFMIQKYINDQAKRYYTNGIIPDDEEEELRSYLTPIYVEFEYWCDEDEEYEAGYEDGKIMFIIDTSDNGIIDTDTFSKDIPEDVVDRAREEALKYLNYSTAKDR